MAIQKEMIRKMVREALQETGLIVPGVEKPVPGPTQRARSTTAVLSVFHAGVRKLGQALEQVGLIEKAAGKSSIYTMNSARSWVCGKDVRDKAGSRCILDTVKPEGLEKVLQKADILVLPTFCFKTAAKVARLIADDQESTIVLSALVKGKPVLAVNDGFTLLNALANQGIKDEMQRVLGKLEGFGMVMCKTEQLAAVFYEMMTGKGSVVPSETDGTPGSQPVPARALVTAKDIQIAANNKQDAVSLAPGGLITPLARDQAKEYNIRIVTG